MGNDRQWGMTDNMNDRQWGMTYNGEYHTIWNDRQGEGEKTKILQTI